MSIKNLCQPRLGRKPLAPIHLVACLMLALFFSACSTSAGVLSGGNWQTSGLAQRSIQTLGVQAGSPTILYAGAAQGNIVISNDSGQHWSEHSTGLPLPDPIHKVASSLDGQRWYAATDKGLFVSSGSAWKVVAGLPADRYTAIDFSVRDAKTLYVGTALHGVLVSGDNGQTWRQAGNGLPGSESINDLVVDDASGSVWGVVPSGVYRLTSQNSAWQLLNSGLPEDVIVNTILPANLAAGGKANLLYLGTSKGFFLSEDGGTHWLRGQVPLVGTSVHAILIDIRTNDAKTLYLATDAGALRSIDGGQEWGLVARGLPAQQSVKALVLGAENYAQLYAAADRVYLYPGTSGGITLERITPLLLLAVFFFLLIRLTQRGRKRRRQASVQASAPENISNGTGS